MVVGGGAVRGNALPAHETPLDASSVSGNGRLAHETGDGRVPVRETGPHTHGQARGITLAKGNLTSAETSFIDRTGFRPGLFLILIIRTIYASSKICRILQSKYQESIHFRLANENKAADVQHRVQTCFGEMDTRSATSGDRCAPPG